MKGVRSDAHTPSLLPQTLLPLCCVPVFAPPWGGHAVSPRVSDALAERRQTCLTEALDQQIAALRRELTLIWEGHSREHSQHELSHAREHEFAQTAIDKAAALAKENKADANEWRSSMNDREAKFATKDDVKAILSRLDNIERLDLVAAERERIRIADEAEDKRLAERRVTRSQWTIGLVVGLLATFGAILVSLVLRLAFPS